jgi:hypothetical protein
MTLRKCTDWNTIEYIVAVCPYCDTENDYYGAPAEGDKVTCINPKCKKKFILGPEE